MTQQKEVRLVLEVFAALGFALLAFSLPVWAMTICVFATGLLVGLLIGEHITWTPKPFVSEQEHLSRATVARLSDLRAQVKRDVERHRARQR